MHKATTHVHRLANRLQGALVLPEAAVAMPEMTQALGQRWHERVRSLPGEVSVDLDGLQGRGERRRWCRCVAAALHHAEVAHARR